MAITSLSQPSSWHQLELKSAAVVNEDGRVMLVVRESFKIFDFISVEDYEVENKVVSSPYHSRDEKLESNYKVIKFYFAYLSFKSKNFITFGQLNSLPFY